MRAIWTVVGLPFLVLPIAFACSAAEGQSRATTPHGPLVIELFTSQGCSSCPPADRLLTKLAANPDIAALSFHVDYWDDLGWADPYASPAWTERQRQYARALGDDRVYTPELVIGGAKGLVGSQLGPVTLAINHAPRPALLPATATWAKDTVTITATAPATAEVVVAIWEDRLERKITRGENAGATLTNDRVVRRLQRVAAAGTQGTITVKLDPAWRTIGAVAFAQRPDQRITASALLPR